MAAEATRIRRPSAARFARAAQYGYQVVKLLNGGEYYMKEGLIILLYFGVRHADWLCYRFRGLMDDVFSNGSLSRQTLATEKRSSKRGVIVLTF